ncbi:M1 family metallopeptidase [Oxyplasma meridianum]|uniref:Aminopeptidase n=1 Tax=Oxyplasma meridianum TaxID=3073602 RepID=A0AAX4NHB2_9ARCH
MEIETYRISLMIDENLSEYEGLENIKMKVKDEKIVLNSVDIDVKEISVNGEPVKFSMNKEKEELNLEGIYRGELDVQVKFRAKVGQTLMGMYQAGSSEHKMISTQFESTGARRSFPCVDNPGYKAVFYVSLTIPEEYEAISNMPVEATEKNGKFRKVSFKPTPRMSTYLLYMGVAKFTQFSRKFHDMEIILAGPKGTLGEPDKPIKFAEESVRYYEDYFGIKYALPKMHLISVPEFGAGAMENWGAITFREVLLLVNSNTSTSTMRRIGEVIAHEIAHQWFGDLVTMKWWNDLWLNESFATFMAFKVMDHDHPEWDMWGDFLLSETTGAMMGDSLEQSHPIDADVKDPNDVAQIFDEISYGKGASILRMIEAYVGQENFRKGISRYLREHSYGNAKGSDLWTAIEKESRTSVTSVMEAWIKRMGYPVIEVSGKDNKISLKQKQFRLNGTTTDQIWPVPVTALGKNGKISILLDTASKEVDVDGFIKLNVDQTGFYRVNYSDNLFENIKSNLSKISKYDRFGIISDLFANTLSGNITLAKYLERVSGFFSETEYIVVQEIASQLGVLNNLFHDRKDLEEISKKFYRNQLSRLGEKKKGEDGNISILRGSISNYLAVLDNDYAKDISRDFNRFENLDPDISGAVAVAYAVSTNDLEGIMGMFRSTKGDENKLKLIAAMGRITGKSNLDKIMGLIKSGEIKKQDSIRFYSSAIVPWENRDFILESLKQIVEGLDEIFVGTGYTSSYLESAIPLIGMKNKAGLDTVLPKITRPTTEKGIKKGTELLAIYQKMLDKNKL